MQFLLFYSNYRKVSASSVGKKHFISFKTFIFDQTKSLFFSILFLKSYNINYVKDLKILF